MPRTPESAFRLTGFRGVRNFPDGDRFLDPSEARSAQNVITSHGAIETRPGFTTQGALAAFAEGDEVKYIVSLPLSVPEAEITSVVFAYATDGTTHKWALFRGDFVSTEPLLAGEFDFEDPPPANFYPQAVSHSGAVYVAVAPAVDSFPGRNSGSFKIYRDDTPTYGGLPENEYLCTAALGIRSPVAQTYAVLGEQASDVVPVGEFTYRHTYYNPATGTESGPSPDVYGDTQDDPEPNEDNYINNSEIPFFHNVHLLGTWPAPHDDQQGHQARIYRRQLSGPGGPDGAWYLLDTIDRLDNDEEGTWHYDDFIGNSLIVRTFETELDLVEDIPPASSRLALHRRRMWWVTDDNKVRYSEFDKPEKVDPRSDRECGSQDDPIRGVISAFGKLIVFKQNSIYGISGSLPANFTVSRLTGSGGCVSAATIKECAGAIYFSGADHVYRLDGSGVRAITASHGDAWIEHEFAGTHLAPDTLTAAHIPWANLYVLNGRGPDGNYHQWACDYVRQTWVEWTLPLTAIADHRALNRARMLGAYGQRVGNLLETQGVDRLDTVEPISWHWETGDLEMNTRRPKKFYYLGLGITAQSTDATDAVEASVALSGGDEFTSLGTALLTEAQPSAFRIGAVSDSIRIRVGGTAHSRVRLYAADIESEIVGYRSKARKVPAELLGALGVVPGNQSYSIYDNEPYGETTAATWVVSNDSDQDVEWYAELDCDTVEPFATLHASVPTVPAVIPFGTSFEVPVLLIPDAFDLPVNEDGYVATLTVINHTSGQRLYRTLTLTVLEGAAGDLVINPTEEHLCEGVALDPISFVPTAVQLYTLTNNGDAPVHVEFEMDLGTLPCWSSDLPLEFDVPAGGSLPFSSTFDVDCAADEDVGHYSGRMDFIWNATNTISVTVRLNVLSHNGGNHGDLPDPKKASKPAGQQPPRAPEMVDPL